MTTSDYNFDPPHRDTKGHAASGFLFSGATQALRILTQFALTFVMARLLEPSDFGLMAMVWPVYSFAMMFNNLGLNQATVQRPCLTSAQASTFFWINVGVSSFVCLLLIAVSPVVGWFYNDQRTTTLTVAMALLVFVSGLGNQHGAIMVRKMEFRLQAILNIFSMVVSLLGSIAWGYVFGGYWALYIGAALGSVVSLAGVWIYVDWRPRRPALVPETREMLRFGLHITGANLVDFVANSVNSVTIGHLLGDRMLGLYDRAAKLLSSPLQQMIGPIGGVMGPILYRLHDDEDRFRRTFLRTIGSMTLIIMPGVIWVITVPDLLINTLMGAKWREATPIFVALSLSALPQLINATVGWLFTAQGRSREYARWSLFNGIISIAALFIGVPFGIVGIAQALVISQFLRTPFLWWYACRTGPVRLVHVVSALMPLTAGGGAAYVVLEALRHSGLLAPWSLLLGGGLLSYAVALATVAVFPSGWEAIKRDYDFLKFMLRKVFARTVPPKPEPLL